MLHGLDETVDHVLIHQPHGGDTEPACCNRAALAIHDNEALLAQPLRK
jgi:hypothetical protein